MSITRIFVGLILIQSGLSILLLCSDDHWGKLFKLPSNLACKNQTYVEWSVKIAKLNIAEYQSSATSLQILSKTCHTFTDFWGKRSVERTKKFITVNSDRAIHLINNKKCFNNENEEKSKLIENYQCDFDWLKHHEKTTISCYFSEGVVIANHDKSFTSSLSNMEGCNYTSGYCLTHSGKHITWNVLQEVKSKYIPVGEFKGVQIDDKLLVPELSMSFNMPDPSSDEWVDREFRISGHPINHPLKFFNSTDDKSIEALRNEITNKFNYLLELIKSPLAQSQYMCNVYNNIYETERLLAKLDPTDYVQWKLNRTDIQAKLVGNLLMVYPCIQINHFKFINESGKCYDGFKIQYQIGDNDIFFVGYVDPKFNMIKPEAVQINCHNASIQYLLVNNSLYAQSAHGLQRVSINSSKIGSIDRLKITGIPMSKDFQNWIYNASELKHYDISDQILDQMEKDLHRLSIDKTDSKSRTTNWWELFGTFSLSKYGLIHAVISNVQSICVWYLIWRYIILKLIAKILALRPTNNFIQVDHNNLEELY